MSRIGNTPITVPKDVVISVDQKTVVVKGPKGELSLALPSQVSLKRVEDEMIVELTRHDKKSKALHGFVRAQIANYVHGVTTGWTKILELTGVGYRATMSGADLVLSLGFSHSITVAPPDGIQFALQDGKIAVSGIDKHAVGQIAAIIRSKRKPEPYKGKGIRYAGEHIRKKAGKSAKAVGGAGGK